MRSIRLLSMICVAVTLSGCAGYRLGPSSGQTPGEKTVQVTPFTNRTPEPRLGDAVTAALRKQLQRDGTLRLATHDPGDVVVTGVLTRYYRHELSFLSNDIDTPQDYQVRLTAQVTARERRSGKVLFDQPLTGYTLIRVGSDLTSTERQALPLLAEDLAKHITALLVDGTW
jgi:hypothetical protein